MRWMALAATVGFVLVSGLVCGCDDGKTLVPPGFELPDVQVGDGVGGPDALSDGRIPDGPDMATDGTIPADGTVLPDGTTLPDGDVGDVVEPSDGIEPSDGTSDTGDAGGPYVPFTPCTKANAKCPTKDEICLLLPNSNEGLCLLDCSAGELCPPWMECVPPDKQKPELKVCLELGPKMGWCNNKKGRICEGTLACLFPPGAEDGVCTTFCTLADEAACSKGSACTVIDLEDPEVDWGACLPAPDYPECKDPAECAAGTTCVQVKQTFRCVPKCAEEGGACGVFGTCVKAELPDMAVTTVCLTFQGGGEICSTAKGLPCKEGLPCADVGAPDGWFRCILPCPEGNCAPGFKCKAVESLGFDGCIPLELALGKQEPCNDAWPCKGEAEHCLTPQGKTNGFCVPGCEAGCGTGTTCQDGGCVTVSPEGGSCLESVGVFCQPPAHCVRDKGAQGPGMCLAPCTPGQPCAGGKSCTETALGQAYCLVPGEFSQLCSLDDGTGCNSAAGLACLHVSADADFGFCSPECSGPGSCPAGPAGTFSECMLKSGGKWYCAFLCGGMGGACPEGMSCSGIGVCAP